MSVSKNDFVGGSDGREACATTTLDAAAAAAVASLPAPRPGIVTVPPLVALCERAAGVSSVAVVVVMEAEVGDGTCNSARSYCSSAVIHINSLEGHNAPSAA